MGPTLVLYSPIFSLLLLILFRERNLGKDTLARSILEGGSGVGYGSGSGKLEGAGLSSGTAHSLPVSASWEWLVKLRRGHRTGSVVFLAKCSSSLQALGGGLGEGVQRD